MHLPSIQIYRGFAAFLVMMYHLMQLEQQELGRVGSTATPWISSIWQNGYAGVDVFFVISGFIMAHVTQNSARSAPAAAKFLFARFARIFPLWWFFVSAYALCKILIHVYINLDGESWAGLADRSPRLNIS